MEIGLVIVAGFAVVSWLFERLRRRHEARWRVREIGDVAGLPLAALLFVGYLLALTPVLNSIIRVQEAEADIFGLNAAQQPDGSRRPPSSCPRTASSSGPAGGDRVLRSPQRPGPDLRRDALEAEHPSTWTTAAAKR